MSKIFLILSILPLSLTAATLKNIAVTQGDIFQITHPTNQPLTWEIGDPTLLQLEATCVTEHLIENHVPMTAYCFRSLLPGKTLLIGHPSEQASTKLFENKTIYVVESTSLSYAVADSQKKMALEGAGLVAAVAFGTYLSVGPLWKPSGLTFLSGAATAVLGTYLYKQYRKWTRMRAKLGHYTGQALAPIEEQSVEVQEPKNLEEPTLTESSLYPSAEPSEADRGTPEMENTP